MISLLEKLARFPRMLRGFGALATVLLALFLLDNLFIYLFDWPGVKQLLMQLGLATPPRSFKGLEGMALTKSWVETLFFIAALAATIFWVKGSGNRSLSQDAALYDGIAAFIIRAAFWSVLLIGFADMIISFLRIEDFLTGIVGHDMTIQLGRTSYRGSHVHYPLVGVAIVIAAFTRSLAFIWLSLMIVAAEFAIVITRFVFSYEQVFMGDLVRFWYAAMFLFASTYTLMNDGHVRVDVLYAGFSERGKAVTNSIGALLFGLPLCWVIIVLGTRSKGSVITSPLLSFEISQSGYGMYIKYLMAAYLLIFAVTMAIQFVSFFLGNMAKFGPQPTESGNSTQTEA